MIDGNVHDAWLSHAERTECLNKAIQQFDEDLEKVSYTFKDHKFGAYLWLYTPDFVRSESIDGIFRTYYIHELFKAIQNKSVVSEIHIEVPLKHIDRIFLKDYSIIRHYKHLKIFKSAVYSKMLVLKSVFTKFVVNLSFLFSVTDKAFTGSLIDTSTRFQMNRYDSLKSVEAVFKDQIKYFSGEQRRVSGTERKKSVVFKRELNLKILGSSLFKSIQILKFINKERKNIPDTFYYNHKGFYKMLLFWDLIISEQCINKFLSKSEIHSIVQVSTFTKPIYRMLSASAKSKGVRFIQVASRSLMHSRCSERLLNCDIQGFNNTAVADYFIVRDKFSSKVFDPFPEIAERIFIGGKYKVNHVRSITQRSDAILLLLNHRKDLCDRLMEEVLLSGITQLIPKIIFRCHPSCVLTESEIQILFPGVEVTDITGKQYEILSEYNIFAISGPTSAALEAVQYGALVFWLPYIWEEGVLLDEIMQEIGLMCDDHEKIFKLVQLHCNDTSIFQDQYNKDFAFCKEFFYSEKLISEQLEAIISI